MLKEIRIHGRGGQGVVTLGELFAIASHIDGEEVQAFPSFGVERRGAPIESFVRISDKKIYRRDQVKNPDYLVILDDTLLDTNSVYIGLDKGDVVILNSQKDEGELKKYFKIYPDIKVKHLDATGLALEILGKPFPNTALLGAFASATNLMRIDALRKAIEEKFSYKGSVIVKKNIEIAEKAYKHIDPRTKFLVQAGSHEIMPFNKERMRVSG